METTLKKSNYPWVIVITALFWSGLIFGLMGNTVGLFYAPVSEEMGWSMKQVSFFMTIYPIVAAVCSPFAGRVFNKYAKTNVILAVVAGVWCLTYVWSSTFTQLWQWTVYGVITGVLGGFLMYIPVPMLINNWFTKTKGLALGIAAAFVNIIPAICNPIVTAQIAAHGWRSVRLAIGIGLAVIVIPITLIFVRKFPKDKNTVAWGEGENVENAAEVKPAALTGVSAKVATKSVAFWLALLAAACLVSCATINQRIASLASARGFDPVAIGILHHHDRRHPGQVHPGRHPRQDRQRHHHRPLLRRIRSGWLRPVPGCRHRRHRNFLHQHSDLRLRLCRLDRCSPHGG